MPRVSDAHKEQRRQAILDAALEVFIGKGYQVATIDDIARRAGLSVGAIYRYFHNKGEIMLTLVEDRLGRTPELFARLTEDKGNPWERLSACVDLFATALRVRHPGTGRLLLVTLSEGMQDGEVRQGLHHRFSDLADYLQGIINEGIASGLFRAEVDAATLATLLLCMADGLTVYWVVDTPGMDLRKSRNAILAVLRSYLIAEE